MLSQQMTEEASKETTPKITAVTKTEKVKDPKRVEAGKRLAAISKEAKARKARERMEAENPGTDYTLVVGAVGVLVAAIGLYYSARRDRREEEVEHRIVKSAMTTPIPEERPAPRPRPVLDSFDE